VVTKSLNRFALPQIGHIRYYLVVPNPKNHSFVISKLREIEGLIAVACMVMLVLITLGNVLTRYFTDQSFAWTEEISVFLMVVMTFAGAASMAMRDQHIRIEFFYESGPPNRQAKLKAFAACITAVFFGLLAYLFFKVVLDEMKYNETTMGLGIPRWWITAWLPVLCLLISVRSLQFAWNLKG
jgi:TRAP-type C4-dicarboxylate transport system permease small subunit